MNNSAEVFGLILAHRVGQGHGIRGFDAVRFRTVEFMSLQLETIGTF